MLTERIGLITESLSFSLTDDKSNTLTNTYGHGRRTERSHWPWFAKDSCVEELRRHVDECISSSVRQRFLSYIERVTNVAYCYDAHAHTTVYVGYCWLHS